MTQTEITIPPEPPTHSDSCTSSSDLRPKRGETIAVVALLATCGFLLYHDFLLCNKLYLFKDIGSDGLNFFYPTYLHISTYLRTYGIPGWSFNAGLGQDLFPFSMGNPFELFIVLLPPDLVGYGFIFPEFAKSVLSGLLIYKAFRLSLFSRPVALLGCVLYSFSGYMVVAGQWIVFSVEPFHVAFLIYALERYLVDRKTGFLIAAYFLIASFNPFHLYLMNVFLFLYGFWRLWNRREPVKAIIGRMFDVGGALVAGIALAAVFFLPTLFQLAQSPRSAGVVSKIIQSFESGLFRLDEADYYVTMYLRMFSNDLEGFLTGKNNYLEAPLLYIGLPVILLAPFCFAGQDRRYRTSTAILLLLCASILIFPAIRHIFWLGTTPYVRFTAHMFSTFLLIVALNGLEHSDCWKRRHLVLLALAYGLSLLALVLNPGTGIHFWINHEIRNLVLGFLTLHGLLLAALVLSGKKRLVLALMLATACAEVVALNSFSITGRPIVTREEQEGRSGYNDYTSDAVRLIKDSDHGFYRIAKEYFSSPAIIHKGLNDAMAQGYYGVSSYQRFNQPNLIRFLHTVGVIDKIDQDNSRWIDGLNGSPLLLSLLNTKYFLTRERESRYLDAGYIKVAQTGDVIILKNSYSLPFGYSYESYMTKADFARLTPEEKQINLMRACLVEDDDNRLRNLQSYIPGSGNRYPQAALVRDVAELSQHALNVTEFQPELIEGNITLDRPRLLLFSMPFDEGWRVLVDGKPEKLLMVNGGLTGIVAGPGEHRLKLTYRSPWRATGVVITLLTALALIMVRRRSLTLPRWWRECF